MGTIRMWIHGMALLGVSLGRMRIHGMALLGVSLGSGSMRGLWYGHHKNVDPWDGPSRGING